MLDKIREMAIDEFLATKDKYDKYDIRGSFIKH